MPLSIGYFPNGNTWFDNHPAINYYACPAGFVPPSDGNGNTDEYIANDSLVSQEFPEETQWTAQRELFERLATDSTALPDSGIVREFYDEKLQGNFADFREQKVQQLQLFESSSLALITANEAQLQDYMQQLRLLDSLAATISDSLMLDSLSTIYDGVQTQVQTLANYTATLAQGVKDQQILLAEAAADNNDAINTFLPYEENEKAVNEVYLAQLGKTEWAYSTEQTAILETIANQCPLAGGTAVYRARSLLSMVNDLIEYDDLNTCAVQGLAWRQQNVKPETTSFLLYPNPASEALHLTLSSSFIQAGKLVLYNLQGQQVGEFVIQAEQTLHDFSVKSFPEGLYFYKISEAENTHYTGKLLISK